jgi:AmiR/NasT family two-component response regulator
LVLARALRLLQVLDEELTPAIKLAIARFQEFVSHKAENSSLKENLEARKLIERAKGFLVNQRNLSKEQLMP